MPPNTECSSRPATIVVGQRAVRHEPPVLAGGLTQQATPAVTNLLNAEEPRAQAEPAPTSEHPSAAPGKRHKARKTPCEKCKKWNHSTAECRARRCRTCSLWHTSRDCPPSIWRGLESRFEEIPIEDRIANMEHFVRWSTMAAERELYQKRLRELLEEQYQQNKRQRGRSGSTRQPLDTLPRAAPASGRG